MQYIYVICTFLFMWEILAYFVHVVLYFQKTIFIINNSIILFLPHLHILFITLLWIIIYLLLYCWMKRSSIFQGLETTCQCFRVFFSHEGLEKLIWKFSGNIYTHSPKDKIQDFNAEWRTHIIPGPPASKPVSSWFWYALGSIRVPL